MRDQIIERAAIIASVETEIGAVQLVAMGQAAGEISLCQLGLPDLCLDLANTVRVLGVEWLADQQASRAAQKATRLLFTSVTDGSPHRRIVDFRGKIEHGDRGFALFPPNVTGKTSAGCGGRGKDFAETWPNLPATDWGSY